MRRIITSSEIIGTFRKEGHEYELCASADGNYDDERCQLVMDLDSCIRPIDRHGAGGDHSTSWLPKPQNVKESVPLDEAREVARDVFQNWVHRVRQSVPFSLHTC